MSMQPRTRLKRLGQLKYMLENHDKIFTEVAFNIRTWYDGEGEYRFCAIKDGKPYQCNTAACALGSAALYKVFNKQGLKLSSCQEPEFKGREGYCAGEEFFGISNTESEWLFNPDSYRYDRYEKVKPTDVAFRVDVLIFYYTKNNFPLMD